jgi:uncharacterized protein
MYRYSVNQERIMFFPQRPPDRFAIRDLEYVAAGASVLGSSGGGSYAAAVDLLAQLRATEQRNGASLAPVRVQAYDEQSNACVLAMLGSPIRSDALLLDEMQAAISNTLAAIEQSCGVKMAYVIPVEIGAINSLVPLVAAIMDPSLTVIDGDGAGRAVPQLRQTTFAGAADLAPGPCAIGNCETNTERAQSVILNLTTTAQAEALARNIVAGSFTSLAGYAGWPSTAANRFALRGNYLPGTLTQAWQLGQFMLEHPGPALTSDMVGIIGGITDRETTAVLRNVYITGVWQNTAGGFDSATIRLDDAPQGEPSAETYFLHSINESLLLYSSRSTVPMILAPDSICYYSETTGCGFSNSTRDIAAYQNNATPISVIKVKAARQLTEACGVMPSFQQLLDKLAVMHESRPQSAKVEIP